MSKNFPSKNGPTTSTPIDPTVDTDQQMGDIYGMTGITQSHNTPQEPHLKEPDQNPRNVSQVRYDMLNDTFGSLTRDTSKDFAPIINENGMDIHTMDNNLADPDVFDSQVIGEQSASGDMSSPESDDDTLEMSHEMGLRMEEDVEHPQPLDIASDIDKAEEYQRTH